MMGARLKIAEPSLLQSEMGERLESFQGKAPRLEVGAILLSGRGREDRESGPVSNTSSARSHDRFYDLYIPEPTPLVFDEFGESGLGSRGGTLH